MTAALLCALLCCLMFQPTSVAGGWTPPDGYVIRLHRTKKIFMNMTLSKSKNTFTPSHPTGTSTLSITLTSVTPVPTMSSSVSLSDSATTSVSLSVSPSFSTSLSESVTPSGGRLTDSISESLEATETAAPTATAGETESVELTTSALPATTSEQLTASATLRTKCPDCVNGVCNERTLLCECYFSERFGHWAGGEIGAGCTICASGYYGSDCLEECPGSACNACFGHGTCDDGRSGRGTCSCFSSDTVGHWNGTFCDECADGWSGVNCTRRCPCYVTGGHGTCDDGRYGTGACACDTGWSGVACNVCNSSIVAECVACPNSCSGHGQCLSIDGGFEGTCECDPFYAGLDCSLGCPLRCSGVGNCSDGTGGTGLCTCPLNHRTPACDACEVAWYGENCTLPCDCSGHGVCDRLSGRCECDEGYLGDRCELQCPRNADGELCGGHGRCVGTGSCQCVRAADVGYYSGVTCDDCVAGFSGDDCLATCDLSTSGEICGGPSRGTCSRDAENCACTPPFCGSGCDGTVDASSGECSPCDDTNSFGPECGGECQCSSHGTCRSGRFGDGSCSCQSGWAGPTCALVCDGGAAMPCSGNGDCHPMTGKCECLNGYATADCSVLCPDCGTHGSCLSGASGTGECECDDGWAWPDTACSTQCYCGGHGTCDKNRVCVCSGTWAGPGCSECRSGWGGSNCNLRCAGRTVGQDCVCSEGFGGTSCDVQCPIGGGNFTCSNNGICDGGWFRSGACLCFPGYVGPACECQEADCGRDDKHQCDAVSGACVCTPTRTGPTCDECVRGYWGDDCNRLCGCAGHGLCLRDTGSCRCDYSPDTGYWTGLTCDQCVNGYFGETCAFADSTLNLAPIVQSRYGGQTTSTTNWFAAKIDFDPTAPDYRERSKEFLVAGGGAMFQAVLDGRSELTRIVSTADAPADRGFCDNQHVPYWSIRGRGFVFAARGICGDFLQLFMGDTLHSPFTYAAVMQTSYKRSGGADMAVLNGQTVFCVASVASEESSGRPTITCTVVVPAATPLRTTRLQLRSVSNPSLLRIDTVRNEVLVAGRSADGRCAVEIVRLEPTVVILSSGLDKGLSGTVVLPRACIAVGCLKTIVNGILVVGATTSTGVALYAMYLADPQRVVRTLPFTVPSGTCEDVAFDRTGTVGLTAFKQRESSVMVKVRLHAAATGYSESPGHNASAILVPYGIRPLQGTSIAALVVDDATKMALGLAHKSEGVVFYRFLLIDALAVTPGYADIRPGSIITVIGRGFYNDGESTDIGTFCRFSGTLAPGIVIDDTSVACAAPQASLPDGCGYQNVEVTLNGYSYTQNAVSVTRVSAPIVTRAEPQALYIDSPSNRSHVLLYGIGFVPTDRASCHFTDGIEFFAVPARYVDGAVIRCDLQGVVLRPLYGNATVAVSLDGSRGTTASGISFTLAGYPSAIVATPYVKQNSSFSVTSFVEPVRVSLVDDRGNVVRETRSELPNSVDASFFGNGLTMQASNDFERSEGAALLYLQDMRYPLVGDYKFDVEFGTWRTNFILRITQGELDEIVITQQPPTTIFAGERLANNTVVQLRDGSGNDWLPTVPTLIACAMVDVGGKVLQRFADQAASIDGDAVFDRLEIDTSLGVQLRLRFLLAQSPHIAPIFTRLIRVECLRTQFQYTDPETGLLSCRPCQVGAICNGSSHVSIVPGYWMGNLSAPVIYRCPTEVACDGGIRSCAEGYVGPLCDSCAPGYGKNQDDICQPCGDDWIAPLVVTVTVLFMLGTALFAILVLVQYHKEPTNAMVIVAMFINFGQTLAAFKYMNAGWPFALRSTYAWAAVITDYQMHSVSSDCILRDGDSTYLDKAVFYYSAMLIVPILVVIVRAIFMAKPTLLLPRIRRATVLAQIAIGNTMDEHRSLPLIAVATQVYLFITYQATLTHALTLFKCREIIDGQQTLTPLVPDASVSCESDEYKSAVIAAYFIAGLYGVAVPMLQMVFTAFVISKFRTLGRELDSQMYLPLLLLGLRSEVWYWNSVILVKKFLLILVIAINDRPLNSYLALWVLNGYLMLVWIVRPYANEAHNFLELFSTFAGVLTVNTGLLNMAAPWSFLSYIVIGLVLLFIAGVLCVFAFNVYEPVQKFLLSFLYRDVLKRNMQRLLRRKDGHGMEEDEEDDADGALAAMMNKIERESVSSEDLRLQAEYILRCQDLDDIKGQAEANPGAPTVVAPGEAGGVQRKKQGGGGGKDPHRATMSDGDSAALASFGARSSSSPSEGSNGPGRTPPKSRGAGDTSGSRSVASKRPPPPAAAGSGGGVGVGDPLRGAGVNLDLGLPSSDDGDDVHKPHPSATKRGNPLRRR